MSTAAGVLPTSLRRELGAVAWCALEHLVERAGDGTGAAVSVRSVAVELGVAKNTAHRALARLAAAGLIDHVQDRDASGRYRGGCYELHLDRVPAPATTASLSTPRRRTPTAEASTEQLSLLTPA